MQFKTRTPSSNLAARAGRWSAQHRKAAIWGWLALVVAAVMIGGTLGTKTLSNDQSGVGESGRAQQTFAKAFPDSASETVLVQSGRAKAVDRRSGPPSVASNAGSIASGSYATSRGRTTGARPASGSPPTVTRRSSTSRSRTPTGSTPRRRLTWRSTPWPRRGGPIRASVSRRSAPRARKRRSASISDDFQRAELTSLPITLLILVIVFGALVAAGVPLLLALTAVAATIGLIGAISEISPVAETINSVVLLIGLAVGVDYSMFYLRREREERAAGKGERASLEAAAATSGRAVLVSGFTVMAAMAGMYVAGDPTFASLATGTILVVAVAVVGSLTVLPAVLAWLGDRVERGRVPLVRRLSGKGGGGGPWAAITKRVLRRPLVSALVAGGVLVALAIPAFSLKTADSGADALPRNLPIVHTYDRIQAAFPRWVLTGQRGGERHRSLVAAGEGGDE